MAGAFRGAKLAESLGFDLTDAFAGYVELLTDLFEGVFALAADAEAETDDLLLFRGEGLENVSGFVADVGFDDGVHRGADPTVFDEIAESGFTIAPDGGLEGDGIAGDGFQLLNFFNRDVHAAADFFICRSTTELFFQFARGAKELVHALVHMHRDADGAGLVGDGAGDGLANPPSGVGREFVAATVLELVGGAH